MKFEELIAISGMPGLFRVMANRSNGLVVLDLNDGKKSFVSSRLHQFTPLASISVYVNEDDNETTPLYDVFDAMDKLTQGGDAIANPNDKNAVVVEYFAKVLPTYDTERVLLSDMKKIIKWFTFINKKSLWPMEKSSNTSTTNEGEQEGQIEVEEIK